MNKKQIIGLVGLTFIFILTIVFKNNGPVTSTKKLQITASFYPLYFFSEQIGGEKVDVKNIIPAGAEPHDYEPTAEDIVNIENSELLILNGNGLEGWSENIKQNIDPGHTALVLAGEGLATQQVMEGGKKIIDPHVWLSPGLAKQMVDKIVNGLALADPANVSYYESNAKNLNILLDKLDNEYTLGLSECAQKNIITSHAAFGYLASAYKFNQIPITGLSPDAEPSPRELGEIADFAKKNGIKYIFLESLVSPKLSETIANEIGVGTLVLNPLEGLSNKEIREGKTYFTEMRANLSNLQIALQCKK